MDWGAQADKIAAAAGGLSLPFMEARPDSLPHLAFERAAFRELSNDRQVGFDHGPIPWASINRYAVRFRVRDQDEFVRFCDLIRAMDEAYLAYRAEKADGR